MIEINKLSKTYDNVLAISNVSLSINPGEIYGFIGPNGAGKSTTIKALLNFITPNSGAAMINGLDIIKNSKEIKSQVAYVSSEVNFYPELTAFEIINIAQRLHKVNNNLEVERLIKLFSIEKDKKIKHMSLGNKKKVAIVSALALNASVLILDEPTNGLDPLMQNILFDELKKLKALNKTIFVSSHNLKEVQDHCDHVAFIKKGRIIKIISLSDKLKEGKYVRVKGNIKSLKNLDVIFLMEKADEISFIYKDDLSDLISILNNINVENLIIENLSIEHQFLEFYSSEEEG